jgi:hypothetical protein
MEITRSPTVRPGAGPAEWFTGEVHLLELAWPGSLLVTFEPAARTAWHTHPHGQSLHIVSGVARVGGDDGAVRELRAGDRVDFAPASGTGTAPRRAVRWRTSPSPAPTTAGRTTDWQDHVTDAEYDA